MRRTEKRVISVILSVLLMFGMALPLCFSISSESPVKEEGSSDTTVTEGLEMSKSYNAQTGLLTLETYVTGESVTTTTQEVDDNLDIVLVLDATTSMNDGSCSIATSMEQLSRLRTEEKYYKEYSYNGNEVRYESGKWQYKSSGKWHDITDVSTSKKITASPIIALRVAASAFINTVNQISENIRIGIVRFGAKTFGGDKTEEYLPLFPCNNKGGKDLIINSLDNIDADYGTTNPSSGLSVGMTSLFADDTTRKKVMILFTDGDPNGSDSEDKCVSTAYTVKQSGITVYTVGIFNDGVERDFLNYVSSKYPNATGKSSSKRGTPVEGTYYFNATDSQNLDNIFQIIAKEAVIGGATITTLSGTTKLRDVISDSFILDNTEDKKIRLYLSKYNGNAVNPWDAPVEIENGAGSGVYATYDPDTRTADITGFDYSKNWCGKRVAQDGSFTYDGYKLIVTIPIKTADSVHGATGINTNDPGSGIIPPGEDKPLQDFPVPKTDIPTDISIIKKFEGYTPQDAQFTVEASVSAHIKGYELPDADGYTKAITEQKTYNGIVLSRANPTYKGINGILVATEERPSTVTVTEKSVPVGYKVTISDGTDSYDFTANGGDVSQTFSVKPGMEITITNNKLTPDVSKVTLKNTVSGNFGDKDMDFLFAGSYMSGAKEQELSEALKHGEDKVIESVDYGSVFVVSAKNSDGYTTTVLVDGKPLSPDNGVYKFTVEGDTVVEFRHNKEVTVDVGVTLDCLPYVLMLAFVASGAAVLVVKRRKSCFDRFTV